MKKSNKHHKKTKPPQYQKSSAPPAAKLQKPDLFGFHAIEAAWLNADRTIRTLYCTDNALAGFQDTLKKARHAGLNRPDPEVVSKEQLDSSFPKGTVHQGLGLVCDQLPELGLDDILIREREKDKSLLVILDQVTDPHNVGAILRSACAFDADGMILQTKHAPDLGGVLAKTACGALEHVPVAFETNLSRAIETLQENGYFVYGLDERGEDISGIDFATKAALVLGAEGPGMRRLVKEHCDALVRLPMQGKMPSINVSNAAAVALYEISKS